LRDEFREGFGFGVSHEKLRQALAQGESHNSFGRRDSRAYRAQRGAEALPNRPGMKDGEHLQKTLRDGSDLEMAIIGGELLTNLRVKLCISFIPFHPKGLLICKS